MKTLALTALALGAVTLFPAAALAQDPPPMPTGDAGGPTAEGETEAVDVPDAAPTRPEGWTPGLAFGGTFNLVDTRSVVGQQDGTTVTLGGSFDGALDFNTGPHEWRNVLKANAGMTQSPALDEFVKTNDGLYVESIYLFHISEMWGPFARAAMNTQMFEGFDIRPSPTNYAIANLDGSTTNLTGTRLQLTDGFQPLTLKQSLGLFVQPLNDDRIKLEGRAGVGAQETFAEGQFAVTDDAATADVVEVKELDSFYQIGGELVANAWGFLDEEKRIAYTVGVGVLIPFAYSELQAGDDRGALDLTNVEVNAGLNVKLFDWASLGYKLAVLRQPLLVEELQVSNSLLLTIGAAFGSKAPAPPAPPPPPECDCEEKPAEPAPAPPAAAEPAPAPAPAPAPPPAPAPAPAPANP